MPSHSLNNFEIQKHYENESRFNAVYSRDNLTECSSTEMKDGAYVINLDEYSEIGTHWSAFYIGGASRKKVGGATPKDVNIMILFILIVSE